LARAPFGGARTDCGKAVRFCNGRSPTTAAACGKLVKNTSAELLISPPAVDPVDIRFELIWAGRNFMASNRKRSEPPRHAPSGGGGDVLVLISMALVVAAIVVGLHIQMGLSLALASLVGMSLFTGLVGFQAWRRSEAEREALSGELHRLEFEVTRLRPAVGPPLAGAGFGPAGAGEFPIGGPRLGMPPPVAPPEHPMAGSDAFASLADAGDAGTRPAAGHDFFDDPAALPVYAEEPLPADAGPAPDVPRFETYRGAPAVGPGESFNDYWSYRPSEPVLEASSAQPPAPPVPPVLPVEPALAPPAAEAPQVVAASAVREDDVEMLQRRIKDMLYQVTVAEQARDLAAALPATAEETAPVAAMGVEASLGALRAAAQSMRRRPEPAPSLADERLPDVSLPMAATVVPPPPPQPSLAPVGEDLGLDLAPPAGTDTDLLAVREAIAAGRVDVFLEPILGLGDQAAQHYEVSIKLRGPASEDLGLGEADVLAGRGLLPLFDTARIERSAIVAERLASRGKTGSVFSRASGEALIEPEFTRNMQMDFVARPATARQLVLTFSQADIRAFRATEQRAVSALSALGFRFAIAGLTDLDMNFAAMAKAGFGFVKLDASVLMHGLAHPGGHVPAGDVCRYLADQGFGLIVEGIDSEETLARVFGFGVLLGQGTLFGGRRPVKADVVTKPGQAAA
jgi:cyclic-di-GMP phosphodiesterase TipF (flagellum assembly factor)